MTHSDAGQTRTAAQLQNFPAEENFLFIKSGEDHLLDCGTFQQKSAGGPRPTRIGRGLPPMSPDLLSPLRLKPHSPTS